MSLRPAVLGLALLCACGATARAGDYSNVFPVNAVLNGGFEWVCDSTVDPIKRGAYWRGAFEYAKGTSKCSIVETGGGNHALQLVPGGEVVSQVLTLYGPHADPFLLKLRVRPSTPRTRVHLLVTTQGQLVLHYVLGDEAGDPAADERLIKRVPSSAPDADGWVRYALRPGEDCVRQFGQGLQPWVKLELITEGGDALIDDVVAAHFLPRLTPGDLRDVLLNEIREILRVQFAPKKGGQLTGCGLVDPMSGYLIASRYDANTGEPIGTDPWVGISGMHDLALRYAAMKDDTPQGKLLQPMVLGVLHRHVRNVVDHNVYEPTGLYTFIDPKTYEPNMGMAVAPSHFMTYVLDAAALFPDDVELNEAARARVLRMADALVEIRASHDLPHDQMFDRGPVGNWYGRMPERLLPDGRLDAPKPYNQAWAISQNRAWYYDFQTAIGLMRAWRLDPKPEYLETAYQAIARYNRPPDASRYDLENDTDDHYGFNVESILKAFEASGRQAKPLLDFAQKATDFRLPRNAPWDQNLWIEGVRLGSFCAGDQPRAFRGPVWLHQLDHESNPLTSGYQPYRLAVHELARADLKRRLLDDGTSSDASSFMWQLISACYKSDFIGPCSMDIEWEGDMGDLFAGPSANGFRALARAIEIAEGGTRREFIGWYTSYFAQTMAVFRRPYGYRFGMSPETARRYGIPDRYVSGFVDDNPYGLSCDLVHADLIASGALDAPLDEVHLEVVRRLGDGRLGVRLSGPPGRDVVVRLGVDPEPVEVGVGDARLRLVPEDAGVRAAGRIGADGTTVVILPAPATATCVVEAELPGVVGPDDLRANVFDVGPR